LFNPETRRCRSCETLPENLSVSVFNPRATAGSSTVDTKE
jgi:hypothetical protein